MPTRPIAQSVDLYTYVCYENDTISNELVRYGEWECNLIRYAEHYLNYDSVILDIGANIGTWSIPLAVLNRTVHSFEPFDSSFYALCGNIFINKKESKIFPHHTAIVDDPTKKTTMFLPEAVNIGGCKLVEVTEDVPHRYELRTLDSFQFQRVDFIKLAVEGQELNALKGAVETIQRCRPVIFFECWAVDSHRWGKTPNTHHELMLFIKSLGYNIKKVNIDGNDNYEALPFF